MVVVGLWRRREIQQEISHRVIDEVQFSAEDSATLLVTVRGLLRIFPQLLPGV